MACPCLPTRVLRRRCPRDLDAHQLLHPHVRGGHDAEAIHHKRRSIDTEPRWLVAHGGYAKATSTLQREYHLHAHPAPYGSISHIGNRAFTEWWYLQSQVTRTLLADHECTTVFLAAPPPPPPEPAPRELTHGPHTPQRGAHRHMWPVHMTCPWTHMSWLALYAIVCRVATKASGVYRLAPLVSRGCIARSPLAYPCLEEASPP